MIKETIFYILGNDELYKDPARKYWMNSNTCRYTCRYPQLGEHIPGLGIFYQIQISNLNLLKMVISKEDSFYFKGMWHTSYKYYMDYFSDEVRYPQVGEYIPGVGKVRIIRTNDIIFIKDEN